MTTTEFDLAAYKTAQQRDWATTAQGWQQFHAGERAAVAARAGRVLCAFGSVALLVGVAAAPDR
jgi:hypothetical protein